MGYLFKHNRCIKNSCRVVFLDAFYTNKIEKKYILEKYEWQKPHQENLTGTDSAYYPNKNKNGVKKKYSSWKE